MRWMVALKPIFPGKGNSDLLYLIMKARGTPSVEDSEHLNPELEADVVQMMVRRPSLAKQWKEVVGTDRISPNCQLLLGALLCWSPQNRLRASHTIEHSYFDSIRRLPKQVLDQMGCQLFNFTASELATHK